MYQRKLQILTIFYFILMKNRFNNKGPKSFALQHISCKEIF